MFQLDNVVVCVLGFYLVGQMTSLDDKALGLCRCELGHSGYEMEQTHKEVIAVRRT